MRGFLYVKGNLTIEKETVFAGVLRVDGRLKFAIRQTLTVFHGDDVSDAIFYDRSADLRLQRRRTLITN